MDSLDETERDGTGRKENEGETGGDGIAMTNNDRNI